MTSTLMTVTGFLSASEHCEENRYSKKPRLIVLMIPHDFGTSRG